MCLLSPHDVGMGNDHETTAQEVSTLLSDASAKAGESIESYIERLELAAEYLANDISAAKASLE